MALQNKESTILYCSQGLFHPSLLARIVFKRLLEEICPTITVKRSIAFDALIKLYSPELIVLYIHKQKIPKTDLDALISFIETGGALLAVHSASASFKQSTPYHQLLGGRFIGTWTYRHLYHCHK